MLEIVSKGFSLAKNLLKKETTLNENNIDLALQEVRLALLEADVAYSVVKDFLARVKSRSLGSVVKTSLTDKKGRTHKLSPHEHFIGIVYEELISLMKSDEELKFSKPLDMIMMVGLQGSGKTTSTAKLARWLQEEHKKKPLLVGADIYRPGAALQLEILAKRLKLPFFHEENQSALTICQHGLSEAKKLGCDSIIFDTAGRLAIDDKLMQELKDIKSLIKPNHTFMVIDAMIGQDAVNTAHKFDEDLDVSGFILTKLDGDARGGVAIAIKEITKKPIRFLGMGEDLVSLEVFRPEGLASRILGMGDIVSLAKDFDKHVTEKEAEEDMKKLMRGAFSFDDFIKQLNMMRKIGSFQSIIERLPGMSDMIPKGMQIDDRDFIKFESMIFSMTKQERQFPELLIKQKNRGLRIAKGSGRAVEDLYQLVDRFMMMRKLMSGMAKDPKALLNTPMFKDMSRMSSIASNYGQGLPKDLLNLMPNMPSPPNIPKSKVDNKAKKDKRKQQKMARKKSKKR